MQFDQSADVAATLATVIDILDASGTDQAGTSLTIRAGAGTGTGAGGSIIFQTADGAGSTGSSVNSHATRVTIADDGDVGIGTTTPTHTFGSGLEIERAGISTMRVENTSASVAGEISAYSSSLGMLVYTTTAHPIAFGTSGGEKMRLDASGDFYIGRTSGNPSTSEFGVRINSTGHSFISRDVNGASSTLRVFGNAGEGRIMGDGDLQNTNNNYGAISDETLKQDIVDAASQWDDIKDIRVRKFRFKDNPEGALQIGVIAQELEASGMNGLVKDVMLDDDDEDSEETVKSVKYSVLYMKAIKALQEAMERIETLETKVAALEG
jgi:hypothetical protein